MMIDILATLILVKPFAIENNVYQWADFIQGMVPSEYISLLDNESNECLVARAAYDIGSSATKTVGAIVDVCKMKVDKVFSEASYPVSYRMDMNVSQGNEFSNEIKNHGLNTLKNAKVQIEDKYIHSKKIKGVIQHCAVATAAFRTATNGEDFVEELAQITDIPINVISQNDEGRLAYVGAIAHFGENVLNEPIVWDIGGASMQLTFKDKRDEFYVMGGELAASTFLNLVLENIMHKTADESPHPMNADEVQQAITLAKDHLQFDEALRTIMRSQINMGSEIVGVGAVHNNSILPLCKLINRHQANEYSKQDVELAISLLTGKTDAEIINLFPLASSTHVKTQLTNLILVYAMMDTMDIKLVKAAHTSNAQGLLIEGC